MFQGSYRPVAAAQTSLIYCCAAIAAVRSRIATYRSPLHNGHPNIDADSYAALCGRCHTGGLP